LYQPQTAISYKLHQKYVVVVLVAHYALPMESAYRILWEQEKGAVMGGMPEMEL